MKNIGQVRHTGEIDTSATTESSHKVFLFHRNFCPFFLEWQSIHEDFLHDGRRRHKILQFQVEDALQALRAESPQFRKFAQKTRKVVWLALAPFRFFPTCVFP